MCQTQDIVNQALLDLLIDVLEVLEEIIAEILTIERTGGNHVLNADTWNEYSGYNMVNRETLTVALCRQCYPGIPIAYNPYIK